MRHTLHDFSGLLLTVIGLTLLAQLSKSQLYTSGSGLFLCMPGDINQAETLTGFESNGAPYVQITVEICSDDTYGSICAEGWTDEDAQVVCSQLMNYTEDVRALSVFQLPSSPVIAEGFRCSGNETNLIDCPFPGFLNLSPICNDSSVNIAAVQCTGTPPTSCSDGDIELVNRTSTGDSYGGRVHVCYNGTFRPVCGEGWDVQDATVVCRNRGYGPPFYNAEATEGMAFGLSNQSVVLQDLMCNGTEFSLITCPGFDLGNVTTPVCLSSQNQAGVNCTRLSTQCFSEGSIQLSAMVYESTPDISFSVTARVDFCLNQTLVGICDAGWDENDAAVICRSTYGGGYLSEVVTGLDYGPTVPVLENISCNGSELSFEECQRPQPGQVNSQCLAQNRAAGVRCYQVCYDGNVRLAGGNNRAIGRVEVCQNNEWGTICNLGWDDSDVDIACRSAGFYWGGVAVENVGFGSTNASILASNVSCNGSYYNLGDCSNTTDIPAICTHELDAAAYCQPGFIDMDIVVNRSTSVMAGNNVTIWCNAQSSSVANFSSFAWLNSRGAIIPYSPRVNITIHNASYSDYYGQFIFNSSLTYSPLLPTDGDLHMCNLTIRLPRVGTNISNTTATAIRVEVQEPIVNIGTVGMDIAGRSLTTTCTAQFFPGVPLEAVQMGIISVNQNRELVNFPPRLSYGDTEQVNETHFQRQATANPLELTYTGRYTCSVGLTSDYIFTVPETNVSFDLIVRDFPAIIDPPISTVARVGQFVTLNCTATGVPAPVVAWYQEGVGLLPTTSNTLTFAPIAPEDRGQYFCRVQNSLGNVTSELATISLEGLQQYIAELTFGSRRRRQIEDIRAGLIGRQLPNTGVEIYNVTRVDGTANATLLITLTTNGDFPPGGVTDALRSEIVSVANAAGEQVAVEITRFDGCPMEQGPAYIPAYPSLSITWPESEIGQTVTANCACGRLNITALNRQATRTCGGTYTNGGAWTNQNVTECFFSPETLQLCVATEESVDMQASTVADIVSDTDNIVTDTFSIASEILVNLLSGAVTNMNIRDSVFQSVESLLNADTEVAKESQINTQSGQRLLDSLDDFAANVAIPSGQSNLMYTQDSFFIVAEQVAVSGFQGLTFGTNTSGSFESSSVQTTMGTSVPETSVASLSLPESLFNNININGGEARLTFGAFSRDTFFQSRVVPRNFASRRVGGPILSAALPGYDVSGLTTPVLVRFTKSPSLSATCVFWDPDLDSGFGQFSDEGCSTDDRREETVCTCDHLTSFTILVTTSSTQPTTQPTSTTATAEAVEDDADHSAVVFLLLSISLVLLILIAVIHLVTRPSRSTEEGKILICYSISLAVLYFIVMLAYGEDMPQGACRLWAFILVYCFNAALLWGFLEALYILLRQQLPSYGGSFLTKNLVWIAMPIIWTVPIIFSFISLAGLDYFGEKRLCQVYNWPFYTFMVAPLVIVYALNWFIYVTTLIKMTRSPSVGFSQGKFDAHRSALFHNFTAMILSLIFGIAWAFGFLASSDDVSRGAYLTGQYLFSFLTLIHTILLLVLPLLRTNELREMIKRLWYTVTCRTQQYKFNESSAPTGRKVSYIVREEKAEEAITLENVEDSGRREKVPLMNEVEGALPIETSPAHSELPGVKQTGAKNLLADAEDATTIANQLTLEPAEDAEEKEKEEEDEEPVSHL